MNEFYSLPLLKNLFVLVVVGSLAAGGYAPWYVATPVAVGKLPAAFEIPPGTRFRAAAQRIDESGVAVGRLQFELLARALGRAQDIKAGSYELATAPTPLELLDKLTRGDVTQADVRFIEGWTFRQLRAALDASPFLKHDTQGLTDAQVLQNWARPRRIRKACFSRTPTCSPRARATCASCGAPTGRCSATWRANGRRASRPCPTRRPTRR